MAHRFAEIAFTPTVRAIQLQEGSRAGYARMDEGEDYNHQLGAREFLHGQCGRDRLALRAASGWPRGLHEGIG